MEHERENNHLETPRQTEKQPATKLADNRVIKKQIVRKYGLFYALFRPLGIAIALLLTVYASITITINYWHGYQRDLAYNATRHIDHTAVEFFQTSSLAKDRVELIIRNYEGALEKRFASKSQLKAEMAKISNALETQKQASVAKIKLSLESLFQEAFENSDKDIENYADWFFEWKRPYIVLKEAISSTTSRLIKLGEYESLRTAVERDMSDYFLKHYKSQVLKPDERDAIIVEGIEKIARKAHENYRRALAESDEKMQRFIAMNTTFVEKVSEGKKLTQTTLDWDAQRWRAPIYLMEDRAFDGLAGMGRIAAGGTLGALALGPAVNRGLSGIFTPLARRFATSMGARITLAEGGALAGTAVEPVGGTVVGAAIGVIIGFAADYVVNKINEQFSRDKFITANREALEGTQKLWQGKLQSNFEDKLGEWYDAARAGLLLARPEPLPDIKKSPMIKKTPELAPGA